MECGKDDLTKQANTASVVLCHDEEDGTEDCISDNDIDPGKETSSIIALGYSETSVKGYSKEVKPPNKKLTKSTLLFTGT